MEPTLNQNDSKALIQKPDQYLADRAKNLDELLDQITLPDGTEEAIISGSAKKLIRDKALGLFKVGEIIKEFLDWNDNVDKDIKEAKKNVLLAHYFQKNESNSLAVSELKSFISSAQGNTLFNKIVRILDDSPPDELLMKHLSSALKHMIDGDFIGLFESHKYALSQIEQISPQALAILADKSRWPHMKLGGYSANGTKLSSDWLMEFNNAYSQSKGVFDEETRTRIRYSISELINRRIVEAHLVGQSVAKCTVTDIGALIEPYISS
ncbi:hypothetical protein L288_09900 [Sphingobium quisquiliarum P25]|uniref:Uncharacterized protein n=1 Tax=Sphingobium quisquiliarum P25 TaxID=1329909 RepID=T0H5M6_9SPHN|nr:hypothetical protein L288_09900 [Sphingobium quisquiliarum P25]